MSFDLGAQELNNVIALVLVVVTAVYVFLTWRISNANSGMLTSINRQYQETVRPVVSVFLRVHEGATLVLVVKNDGSSPARDVKINIDKDFYAFAQKTENSNIRNFSLFSKGTDIIAPSSEFVFYLSQGFNFDTQKDGINLTPSRFSVNVRYRSLSEKYEETYPIDISPYINSASLKSVSEQLKEINETLKKISRIS